MIEIKNLSRSFGPIKAVDDISFAVDKGEIVGFLGPNGAGKTTTMRMMVGFLQPEAGQIELDGESVFQDPLAASARMGYLPEHNPLYDEMGVSEFLVYMGKLRRLQDPVLAERLEFVREKCGLDPVWRQPIKTLSKGFRQRTGLAQAILHDPEVLILDEPTGGLDPNQILEIRELIRELGKAKTVILSSHIMQEVQALCSRVIIINAGRIIVDDQMENLGSHINGFNRLVLEVEAREPDFRPWLEQFSEVQLDSMIQTDNVAGLEFLTPPDMDIRKELSAFVLSQGWQLVSIYQEKQSLESIFHELTAPSGESSEADEEPGDDTETDVPENSGSDGNGPETAEEAEEEER
ncbi:MAG: ATP-binding cassette domain-containing protein [Candidatus Syntrophosphaera sp.]|nr:ATP-binding cassette domain-containing protein [Candidatus Syntrophosphaera sp.]